MPAVSTACACVRLRRASRAVTALYDQALAPTGLKLTQFSALRTLQRLGTVSISELAVAMALDRSTLGRNLLVLKRRGLVRLGDGEDMRAWSVALTAKAGRLLEKALPGWSAAQDRVRATLGPKDMETLFALLEKLEANP